MQIAVKNTILKPLNINTITLMKKICTVCGKNFESQRSDAKTCSDYCRVKLSNLSKEQKGKDEAFLNDHVKINDQKEEKIVRQILLIEKDNALLIEKINSQNIRREVICSGKWLRFLTICKYSKQVRIL